MGDKNNGPIIVDQFILATYIQNLSGKKRKAEDKAKADGKAKADALKANTDGTTKKLKVEGEKGDKKICFAFRDSGKCQYGAECYFAHVKA